MAERILTGLVVVPFLLGAAVAPVDEAQVVFSFQDNDIVESSGLVVARGLVVTTNDSGDTGRVFTVDPATGETVGTTGWSNDPQDVEALAPLDDNDVWVGDIGDNAESSRLRRGRTGADRERQQRHRRPDLRPRVPRRAAQRRDPDEDPPRGRLYVARRRSSAARSTPRRPMLDPDGANGLEPLGDVLPIATDGAFLPDGKHFVVRNYAVAAVYAFPSLEKVATSSSSPASRRARASPSTRTAACCSARRACTPRC